MTDEERQKLCNALRSQNWFYGPAAQIAEQAAAEIDRLVKEANRLQTDDMKECKERFLKNFFLPQRRKANDEHWHWH